MITISFKGISMQGQCVGCGMVAISSKEDKELKIYKKGFVETEDGMWRCRLCDTHYVLAIKAIACDAPDQEEEEEIVH